MGTSPPAPLFSPEFFQNPYPTYSWLRENDPFHEFKFPMVDVPVRLVTRYEDAIRLLGDNTFSTDAEAHANAEFQAAGLSFSPLGRTISLNDPPDHTRIRRLVMKTFTPRNIDRWRQVIDDVVEGLIDGFASREQIEVVKDYAAPIPAQVIGRILGMESVRRELVQAQTAILGEGNPATLPAACEALLAYVRELIAEKRQSPDEHLVSQLIAARHESDRLSDSELVGTLTSIITAGFETTQSMVGNGTLSLLDHPDQRQLFLDRPDLTPAAIEEMLRYEGSAALTLWRFPKHPVTFAGVELAAGTPILISPIAANHDPAQFDRPDTFDITRPNQKHMAFGHGIHNCLGAALARLEGQIAIRALAVRFPDMCLAVERSQVRFRESFFFRGVAAVPVRLR